MVGQETINRRQQRKGKSRKPDKEKGGQTSVCCLVMFSWMHQKRCSEDCPDYSRRSQGQMPFFPRLLLWRSGRSWVLWQLRHLFVRLSEWGSNLIFPRLSILSWKMRGMEKNSDFQFNMRTCFSIYHFDVIMRKPTWWPL